MPSEPSQLLVPFGFTSLESEIYAHLLKESPATGYRVAQALGKAAANVYKAIESLQQKGAVLVEEGANRSCRAVPSAELLARLTRDFEWRRAEAELMLARLSASPEDERIYSLRSRAQVVERARQMVSAAESAVLMVCSAHIAHQLADSLAGSGARRVPTLVACSDAIALPGVSSVLIRPARPIDEVRLVADASEHLLGHFVRGREEVAQAVWSRSPFLAVSAYRGLAAELADLGLAPPEVESTPGYRCLLQNLTEV